MKRKICVVTGRRAEYGSLYWLIKEIQEDSQLILQLIVTGMHLSPEFGWYALRHEAHQARSEENDDRYRP